MVRIDPIFMLVIIVIGIAGLGMFVSDNIAYFIMGLGVLAYFLPKFIPSLEGKLMDQLPEIEFGVFE